MRATIYLVEILFRIKRDKRGAVAVEYSFLIAFIAIVAAIGMVVMGTALGDYFTNWANAFSNAGDAVNPS